MNYHLPNSLKVCGTEYAIRSDYRAALDIFAALADPELSERDKSQVLLDILYEDFGNMPQTHYRQAIIEALKFLNCGNDPKNESKKPQLVDWEQDFQYIAAPINRVIGQEIRAMEYLHWWSFISAYYEIGDCTFAQVVRIRNQKGKGKKLDKWDAEWYKENREIVDIKTKYTEAEKELLQAWG